MSSPGQRRGLCGHLMAGYDKHKVCARCRDKKKGDDPCVGKQPCPSVIYSQKNKNLSWPLHHIRRKKEKRELKTMEESSSTLVDPSLVSVIGLAKDNGVKSSEEMSTTAAKEDG